MIKSILFIFSFLTLIYFIAIQFVYAQTVENEIIENTLERVGNATTNANILETLESLKNASESTDSNKQQNQSEYKIYENQNIGVRFKMPSTWWILFEFNNTKNCFDAKVDKFFIYRYENCGIELWNKKRGEGGADFSVQIIKFSSANYSLADFLTLKYESDKKHYEDYFFINDKEMTIQNNPAWQMKFIIDGIEQMNIATKTNNIFYIILYGMNEPYSSDYSKFLPEFENFVKSIEFIPSIKPEEIEPLEPIKLKPSFLKYSTLENITNNNETIEQTQGSKITTINNITDLLFDKYYPIVKVIYESDSMVVLEGNENYLSEINGSLVPFWESIDIVKNQGYSLNEITTLGTGNEDNPIIFYAIFFNNSNNKISK